MVKDLVSQTSSYIRYPSQILLEQFTPKAIALCRGERQSSLCIAFDILYLLALEAVYQPQGAACACCWPWVYTPKFRCPLPPGPSPG